MAEDKKKSLDFKFINPLDDLADLLGFGEQLVEKVEEPTKSVVKKEEPKDEPRRARESSGNVNVNVSLGDKLEEFFSRRSTPSEKTRAPSRVEKQTVSDSDGGSGSGTAE